MTRVLLAPITVKVVHLAVGTYERNFVDHVFLSFYLVSYFQVYT